MMLRYWTNRIKPECAVGERDWEEIAVQTKSGSSVFVMRNECLCDMSVHICVCVRKPSIESVPPPAIFYHKWFLGFGLSNCFLFVLLNSQNIFEMLMPVRAPRTCQCVRKFIRAFGMFCRLPRRVCFGGRSRFLSFCYCISLAWFGLN